MRRYINTTLLIFNRRLLFSVSGFVAIIFFVFFYTRGVEPHTSELAFIEHASSSIGSVVPASCESEPPEDHPVGTCPPEVRVNIRDSFITVTASFTGVTQINAWDLPITMVSPGLYYSGNNDSSGQTVQEYTVSYNSTNADECWNGTANPLPSSGSWVTYVRARETRVLRLRCSNNGVIFSPTSEITLYGNFDYEPPVTTDD